MSTQQRINKHQKLQTKKSISNPNQPNQNPNQDFLEKKKTKNLLEDYDPKMKNPNFRQGKKPKTKHQTEKRNFQNSPQKGKKRCRKKRKKKAEKDKIEIESKTEKGSFLLEVAERRDPFLSSANGRPKREGKCRG